MREASFLLVFWGLGVLPGLAAVPQLPTTTQVVCHPASLAAGGDDVHRLLVDHVGRPWVCTDNPDLPHALPDGRSWWATGWIKSLYIVLLAFAIWRVYRMRIDRISQQMVIRMEERIAERTRIAQELHDTLLQGLMSASLQLAVANNQLPADAPAKPLVSRVYEMLRQLIQEGRNTVRGLRIRPLESDELERAISLIPKDIGADSQVEFKMSVEGTPRSLRSAVRDDVYWIAREALVNAYRHSGARRIEGVLEYSRKGIRMVIRDDGCGMDEVVVRSGREGHWGLAGMNERSERIAARLDVLSAPGAGTEIDLRVPGQVAFEPGAGHD
jgi:signal transduction histidine kinase